MQDSFSLLKSLRRPPLLIRAARFGLADYSRERDLRRLVKTSKLPGPRQAILHLMEEEAQLNDARKQDGGMYNVTRHVQIMIALLGEASLIEASPNGPNHLKSV